MEFNSAFTDTGEFAFFWAFFWPILIVALWSIVWKGLALWRAAKLGSKGWFIALMILNTAGILEIIYLLATNKSVKESSVQQ